MDFSEIINIYKDSTFDINNKNILVNNYLEHFANVNDYKLQLKLLKKIISGYVQLEKRVDKLLKNTLPEKVADEIKKEGFYHPRNVDCSIMFLDIVKFTKMTEELSNEQIVNFMDQIFQGFDIEIQKANGIKIRTIGDAYMSVFGALNQLDNHARVAINTAIEFLNFLTKFNVKNEMHIQARIGIHSGNVITGVVGHDRLQYDLFGSDVIISARFESSGEAGKINVSETTYHMAKQHFKFFERGKIELKNKKSMNAYFVESKI